MDVIPDRVPAASELGKAFLAIDMHMQNKLSTANRSTVGEWAKINADNLRNCISMVRALRRKTGVARSRCDMHVYMRGCMLHA